MTQIIDRIDNKTILYEIEDDVPFPDGIYIHSKDIIITFEFIKFGMWFYNERKNLLETLDKEYEYKR